MLKKLCALLAVLLIANNVLANEIIKPGVYNNLMVGFDPTTQIITGYFEDYTGENQQFSCIFYFEGQVKNKKADIISQYPNDDADKIAGDIKIISPTDFIIHLKDEHGGCWNVQHFADDSQPAEFILSQAKPWQSIQVVKTAKAFLYDKPVVSGKTSQFKIQNAIVSVITSQGNWYKIDNSSESHLVSAWMQKKDFAK